MQRARSETFQNLRREPREKIFNADNLVTDAFTDDSNSISQLRCLCRGRLRRTEFTSQGRKMKQLHGSMAVAPDNLQMACQNDVSTKIKSNRGPACPRGNSNLSQRTRPLLFWEKLAKAYSIASATAMQYRLSKDFFPSRQEMNRPKQSEKSVSRIRSESNPAPVTSVDPAQLVRIEAQALLSLADRLENAIVQDFAHVVEIILACGEAHGRVVVTGMGKSGIIAQKIAATLSSTGSPSLFPHPARARPRRLGMLAKNDVVLALSGSGETEEILLLLEMLKRIGTKLICFCCNMRSTLALASDVALDCSVEKEACTLGLAPTASTTAMLALGDALAIAISARKGFCAEDFANLHPGGKLGKRLMRVEQLMHAGEAVPRVALAAPMKDVIYEMSRKGLGITTVVEEGKLAGLLSDGDLRRLLEQEGAGALAKTAGEAMHRNPQTIAPEEFAAEALRRMEEKKITSLIVVDDKGSVAGVIHLHDLWGTELF